jgi:hypothetical protein
MLLERIDEFAGSQFFANRHSASQLKRMGDDDQDRIVLFRDLHEQLTDLLSIWGIEIASGLIGQ